MCQGCLGLWGSTGSNCFALAALNPLQLLATHLLSSSSELRGPAVVAGALTLDLFIIFGLLSSTRRCSVCPHPASCPTHRLITSTIISSWRGMNSTDEEDEEERWLRVREGANMRNGHRLEQSN